MAIRDAFKISRKTFFNPRAWLGIDSLKEQTQTIRSFVKDATTVQKPERTETFEEAMERLSVKEKDLQPLARRYFFYALFFVALAGLDFIYGMYLLFHHGAFLGLILALGVCALLLSQAFRFHFWYFQIQRRKLGCTYDEWRNALLGKKGKSA